MGPSPVSPSVIESIESHSPTSSKKGSLSPPAGRKWAGPKDWTPAIRDHVTRLYLEEDKTLREVMAIMAKDYNHHAT